MQQLAAQVAALTQEVQVLREAAAAAPPPAPAAPTPKTPDLRSVSQLTDFDGLDAHWRDWSTVFVAYINATSAEIQLH